MTIDLTLTLSILGGLVGVLGGFAGVVWKINEHKHRLINQIKEVDRKHREANVEEREARQALRAEMLELFAKARQEMDALNSEIKEVRTNQNYVVKEKTQRWEFEFKTIYAHLKNLDGYLQRTGNYSPRSYPTLDEQD